MSASAGHAPAVPKSVWSGLEQDVRGVADLVASTLVGARKKPAQAKGGGLGDYDVRDLEFFFSQHDLDGDGRLSMQEVKKLLADLARAKDPAAVQRPGGGGGFAFTFDLGPNDLDISKLGAYYQELLAKLSKQRHFSKKEVQMSVKKLNRLNASMLKQAYYNYCVFGMGHGSDRQQHTVMEGQNFAKLCRECGIVSSLPKGEADIFFAAVSDLYSKHMTLENFLHALLMVAEESRSKLEDVVSKVIGHVAPEMHVRTAHPFAPVLKTATRDAVWQKAKETEDD